MSMFRGRRAPLKGMGRAAVYWGARWVSGHTIPLITQLLFLFILDLVYFVFLRGAGRSLRLGMGNSYDTYCTYAQQIMITAMPWDTSFVTSVTNLFGTFVSQMTFRPWNERKCREPIQASQIQPTPQKVECVCYEVYVYENRTIKAFTIISNEKSWTVHIPIFASLQGTWHVA